MFLFKYIKYRIFRNKILNISSIFISISFICLIFAYYGSLLQNDETMQNLETATPVTGEITNPNGYKTQNLAISELVFDRIMSLDIKNEIYSILLSGTTQKYSDDIFPEISILSANKILNVSEDFLTSKEPICLIDENYLKDNKLKIGDDIKLNLYYRDYDAVNLYWSFHKMSEVSLEIVGTFSSKELNRDANIITPINFTINQITNFGEPIFYDSLSFTVANPLKLNEFKESLSDKSMSPVASGAVNSYIGRSVRLDDKLYIENAEQLMKTKDTLNNFVVPFFILLIFLVFLTTNLAEKSQTKNINLAISLGANKRKIIFSEFISIIFLNVFACAVIIPLSVLFTNLSFSKILICILTYLICTIFSYFISLVSLKGVAK